MGDPAAVESLYRAQKVVRFDLRILASFAFIAMSLTSFARSHFNLDVDFQHVALVQLFQGLGVALFFMPVLQILLSDLEPHEIAVGMAFPRDYRWQGIKRERVRLAGNAVTPPAARDLITVLAESLGVAA